MSDAHSSWPFQTGVFALALVLSVWFGVVSAASAQMSDAQIVQDLRAHIETLAAQDRFSGAVLLAKNNQALFEHAYGYADHAFDARNNVDTKFNLASVGKMFTAVAIMQLEQEGKLSVDDTLLKLVPDYPNKDAAAQIIIGELLTHTSRLGDKVDFTWTTDNGAFTFRGTLSADGNTISGTGTSPQGAQGPFTAKKQRATGQMRRRRTKWG